MPPSSIDSYDTRKGKAANDIRTNATLRKSVWAPTSNTRNEASNTSFALVPLIASPLYNNAIARNTAIITSKRIPVTRTVLMTYLSFQRLRPKFLPNNIINTHICKLTVPHSV